MAGRSTRSLDSTMGFGVRIANRLGLLLIGERISPVTMPCRYWDLSRPKVESRSEAEILSLSVHDARFPRMKGSISFEIGDDSTIFRWRTRASSGWTVLRRPIKLSDDGYFSGGIALGRLSGDEFEMATVRRFLEGQRAV